MRRVGLSGLLGRRPAKAGEGIDHIDELMGALITQVVICLLKINAICWPELSRIAHLAPSYEDLRPS
ncbi:Uncharacterised protein [Pandoraea pulmonicola]|uniref:Uncharacterized protein n=1 Tax=Pandoraea pulmonicola TaxID=93221 RepID=A0AAJ4Z867_PANPU|nr:Uncharacterised protein [Pandoraea pulmonicola]